MVIPLRLEIEVLLLWWLGVKSFKMTNDSIHHVYHLIKINPRLGREEKSVPRWNFARGHPLRGFALG
jgi:hypothetical protein